MIGWKGGGVGTGWEGEKETRKGRGGKVEKVGGMGRDGERWELVTGLFVWEDDGMVVSVSGCGER